MSTATLFNTTRRTADAPPCAPASEDPKAEDPKAQGTRKGGARQNAREVRRLNHFSNALGIERDKLRVGVAGMWGVCQGRERFTAFQGDFAREVGKSVRTFEDAYAEMETAGLVVSLDGKSPLPPPDEQIALYYRTRRGYRDAKTNRAIPSEYYAGVMCRAMDTITAKGTCSDGATAHVAEQVVSEMRLSLPAISAGRESAQPSDTPATLPKPKTAFKRLSADLQTALLACESERESPLQRLAIHKAEVEEAIRAVLAAQTKNSLAGIKREEEEDREENNPSPPGDELPPDVEVCESPREARPPHEEVNNKLPSSDATTPVPISVDHRTGFSLSRSPSALKIAQRTGQRPTFERDPDEELRRVLDWFASWHEEPKTVKRGGYLTRCPIHNDLRPSLHISPGTRGASVVAWCYRCGDVGRAVLDVVNGMRAPLARTAKTKPTTQTIAGDPNGDPAPVSRVTATFLYRDEQGIPTHKVNKIERTYPDGVIEKDYPIYRRAGDEWRLGEESHKRGLYNADRLAADPDAPVLVTEGEGDANTAVRHGFLATTRGSATSWRPELAEALRGRKVFITPDADEPGRSYGQAVLASLQGIAADVRVVELHPDRDDGSDLSDWFAAGHTSAELRRLIGLSMLMVTDPTPCDVCGCFDCDVTH